MNNPVVQTLSSITLGTPATCESITMFPLVGRPELDALPFYLTLDQAIGDGWTEVTEISELGVSPSSASSIKVRRQGWSIRSDLCGSRAEMTEPL